MCRRSTVDWPAFSDLNDFTVGLHWAYASSVRTYRRDIWRFSTSRVRGRNLLTRPIFSITGWAAEQQASASVFPDIGGSAGASQHATSELFSSLPQLDHFSLPSHRTTDSSSHFRYVSDSIYIYIYTLFQFPVHLLHCPEGVREKDKEGSSRSSARSTVTSL